MNGSDPQVLADRLDTGWLMCEREAAPERKERLERHWVDLLHEYQESIEQSMPAEKTPWLT